MRFTRALVCVLSMSALLALSSISAIAEEIVDQVQLPLLPTGIGIDTALQRVYVPGISLPTSERFMDVYNVRDGSHSTLLLAEPDLYTNGVAVNSRNGRVYLRGGTSLVVVDGYTLSIVKTVDIDLLYYYGTDINFPDNISAAV
jgi:hypothetical protein